MIYNQFSMLEVFLWAFYPFFLLVFLLADLFSSLPKLIRIAPIGNTSLSKNMTPPSKDAAEPFLFRN